MAGLVLTPFQNNYLLLFFFNQIDHTLTEYFKKKKLKLRNWKYILRGLRAFFYWFNLM